MAIYRLLKNQAFDPQAIRVMSAAYEQVLRDLRLANRSDPITEIIARKVIEFAQQGEQDPARLSDLVERALTGSNGG